MAGGVGEKSKKTRGGLPKVRNLPKPPKRTYYGTTPHPKNASDLADFHRRQRHSRRFEGKRREIAAGLRRMGRREVVQPDRCWQARSRWKGGSIPRQGPPVMRNGPLPLCVTGSRRKKVVASTYSSSGHQDCQGARADRATCSLTRPRRARRYDAPAS